MTTTPLLARSRTTPAEASVLTCFIASARRKQEVGPRSIGARATVHQARKCLKTELGRDPLPEEIAVRARRPLDLVTGVLRLEARGWSINDQNSTFEPVEEASADDVEVAGAGGWHQRFSPATLTGLERRVLELRQGLDLDGAPKPRKLVARMLWEEGHDEFRTGEKNWGEERVREIEITALGKLRRAAELGLE